MEYKYQYDSVYTVHCTLVLCSVSVYKMYTELAHTHMNENKHALKTIADQWDVIKWVKLFLCALHLYTLRMIWFWRRFPNR